MYVFIKHIDYSLSQYLAKEVSKLFIESLACNT